MRRHSETLLLFPLLPIFLVGMFPMLLIGLLGFAGLAIFGILLISVGLSSGLEAHDDFNRDVIVHGHARDTERSVQASDLHAATRLALHLEATGVIVIAVAAAGFFCIG
jgi:hypothetical protein